VNSAERYQAAKTADTPRCTYGACRAAPCEDALLCSRHRAEVNARQAQRARQARAQLREAGRCVTCRKPSGTYRCPACRIACNGNLPTTGVHMGVRTTGDQWREDRSGWKRFRGRGERGRVGAQADDALDLAQVEKLVARGKDALAYAYSPAVAEQGAITRRSALHEACAPLEHAARFLDEICDRHKRSTS
jgi:hypothetical protein